MTARPLIPLNRASLPFHPLKCQLIQLQNIRILGAEFCEDVVGNSLVEVDSRDGGFGALEDDVLHFLDVDGDAPDGVEHAGEDAGTVAMANEKSVRGGCAARKVDDVGYLADFLEGSDDADRFGSDRFLGLIG